MQVHGAHAGLTYWLREENTDPALLEEARRLATELERLAPLALRGLPLPSAEHDDISGGLRVVASGGRTKKGGAVRAQPVQAVYIWELKHDLVHQGIVKEDGSEGLHIAGWCNEIPRQGGGNTESKGTRVATKLELTLLVVNSGIGRRGGVRVIAPSSARWLEAKPSYARDIISLPTSDEQHSSQLTIQQSSPGRLQLSDSAPLPKYGASEHNSFHTALIVSRVEVPNHSVCLRRSSTLCRHHR